MGLDRRGIQSILNGVTSWIPADSDPVSPWQAGSRPPSIGLARTDQCVTLVYTAPPLPPIWMVLGKNPAGWEFPKSPRYGVGDAAEGEH